MGFISKRLLDNVANGDISIPESFVIDVNAESIFLALPKQLSRGFTGKKVVEIKN